MQLCAPIRDEHSDLEDELKLLHFSRRRFPFEDEIVDVIVRKGSIFAERYEFLTGLIFVLKKGYYFTYKDVCHSPDFASSLRDKRYNAYQNQPFDVYLDGVMRIAFCYAFGTSIESTTGFILQLLKEGKFTATIGRDGKHHFSWALPWQSWITAQERKN